MFFIHIPWYERNRGYSLSGMYKSIIKIGQGLSGGPEATGTEQPTAVQLSSTHLKQDILMYRILGTVLGLCRPQNRAKHFLERC